MLDVKLEAVKDLRTIQGTQLHRVLLKLNQVPDAYWKKVFHEIWKTNIYDEKVKVDTLGESIALEISLADLEEKHVPQLKRVIDETNKKAAADLAELQESQRAKAAAIKSVEIADTAKLAELQKNLKF